MAHSLLLTLSLLSIAQVDAGAPVLLIPRELLFGSPERMSPRVSPDAKRLAYLAPDAKNVMQVWVRTLGSPDDAAVTEDKKRGLRWFAWGEDSKSLFFSQDTDGDENFHLFLLDLTSKNTRDLTPWAGIRAQLLKTSPARPDEVLVTMNVRDRKQMDVWRINLKTGGAELDTQNPGDVLEWKIDPSFVVRGAVASTPEGGTELRLRDGPKAPWKPWITAGLEENLAFIDFTNDNRGAFVATSISTDTMRVVEKNLRSGTERFLAQSPTSDPFGYFVNEAKHALNAVAFDVGGHQEWTPIESGIKSDLEALKLVSPGDLSVENTDRADTVWVVSFTQDKKPTRFFTWDRKAKKASFLFSDRPRLEDLTLSEMKPISFAARDGLKVNGYLSVPPGSEGKKLPLVVLVHGGPWARDRWGFSPLPQLLTNRGAAVLQINFRGSTGYGKQFLNAGNRQWGLAMHTDVLDGVAWAVQQGGVDADAVAIMGGSYGGYETLVALTSSPETFKCGVDLVGPVNLSTLLNSVPPYWESLKSVFFRRIGNPADPADAELLKRASPLFSLEKLAAPLLIGQGASDPRVKTTEAEQLLTTLEKRSVRVTYALYPDEGHGFARPENRLDFYARAEGLLAACLKLKAEPLPKEGRVAGSSALVKEVGVKPSNGR